LIRLPLLNRRKLKRELLYSIQFIFKSFKVNIDTTKIVSLIDDIFEDYKTSVEKLSDFNQRKKAYVPDCELLLKKYICHVSACEGTDFLSHIYPQTAESFSDIEYDFLINLDIKFKTDLSDLTPNWS
jgi:hypothetical protein